ncbi:hypothetical protein [Qipengyuania sp.]|uniref:hypothetical protein n=1 Tax=Qipengyuania sp. TaxID=2004515 RepID=UPI0035C7FD3F
MPEVFENVLQCRSIADEDARLVCFDKSIASLDEARRQRDVVIVSREEVRDVRRGLFGLSLPRIKLFGSRDGDESEQEEFSEISSTIAGVGRGQRGLVLKLADGAVWEQTDKVYLGNVQEGDTITIKRAALGSYMAKIGGSRGARVKRIE